MFWRAAVGRYHCCLVSLALSMHVAFGCGFSGHAAEKPVENSGIEAATEQQAPAQPEVLRYRVELVLPGGSEQLRDPLTQVSRLVSLAPENASDFGTLAARARADMKLLTASLYDAGHFGGTVSIRIAGKDVNAGIIDEVAASKTDVVPVAIEVAPGPVFLFGTVELQTTSTTQVAPPMEPSAYQLIAGKKASTGVIVKAVDQIVEEWRGAGYPFARVSDKEISADHATHKLNVRIAIDPGRSATYGWLNVAGSKSVSPKMVSRYSGLQPGRTYNPKELTKAAERLRKLDAVESVRISHGDKVDDSGGVPITLSVTERKPRFIGAAAAVSTVDGGELSAYWGHRNLFGRAERLKIEGAVSQIGSDKFNDLQYVGQATFTVPGILDIDTDLVTEFRIAKERPETYESRSARFKIGLNHRFSETLSGSAAFAATVARDEDAFGIATYRVASAPMEIVSDTRDSKLDPKRGWRGSLGVEPAHEFYNDESFVITRAQLSGYQSLDNRDRVVFAARFGMASIVGSDTFGIPASMRLYGGGSGSVRGYAHQSIGPVFNGRVVGGRGLAEGSLELRWRASNSIGFVGFVDAAAVSAESIPIDADIKIGAGVGIRYYTSLGPIRMDLAVPIENNDKLRFSDVAFYVGLGQAF